MRAKLSIALFHLNLRESHLIYSQSTKSHTSIQQHSITKPYHPITPPNQTQTKTNTMSSNTTDSSKPAEAEAQPGYYETAKQYASSGAQYASDSVSAGTSYVGKKYEEALPWIEDKYLQYFTNDNKASYATKGV